MRKTILVTGIALIIGIAAFIGESRAGYTTNSMAQIEKLGGVRTRVTARLIELQRLSDQTINGTSMSANAVLGQFYASSASLNRRLQIEGAKPADSRDQAVMTALSEKLALVNNLWNLQSQRDGPVFTQQFGDFQNTVYQITQIINNLSQLDVTWVRAEADPALLTADFIGIDKRIDEVIAQGKPLVDNFNKLCADRVHQMED